MAKVQMEAALSKGVSWGMAGDDQVLALGVETLLYFLMCLLSSRPAHPPALAVVRVSPQVFAAVPGLLSLCPRT